MSSSASTQAETQRAFLENLKRLCGQQFEGETVFPPDKDHPLAGKRLVISVETCREKEIRIPFHVGEDKSRTWIPYYLERHGEPRYKALFNLKALPK